MRPVVAHGVEACVLSTRSIRRLRGKAPVGERPTGRRATGLHHRNRGWRLTALATLTGTALVVGAAAPAYGFLGLDGLLGGGGSGGLLGLGKPKYTVEFDVASYAQTEDGGMATVVLERRGSSGLFGSTTTVHVRATGGSATEGDDYQPIDVEVVFTRQEQFATVDVPIVGDARYEHDETVVLEVEGDSNTAVGPQGSTTVTIANDDDPPEVSVAVLEPAVEGANVQASVTLEGATDVPAAVGYATADGGALAWSDYVPRQGIVTFPPGTVERTIAVMSVQDDRHEDQESFVVQLSDPVDATIATATAIAGITDDDVPHLLSVADSSVDEGGALHFTVGLSRPSTERVSVDYATEDGTATAPGDYAAKAGTLTIDPGQTTATFDVPTVSDSLPELDEQLTVRLWNPQGATIGDGTAVGSIVDATPLPVMSIAHSATVVEGAIVQFDLALSEPSPSPVTVRVTPQTITAAVGADLVAGAVTATFSPGSLRTGVQFHTTDDGAREDFETFRAVLSHPSGATIGVSQALATIRDDDQCTSLTPGERVTVLNRWLSRLDPAADDDGDGFTNGEELGILAFDPAADPTRFNPLIADTPKVSVKTIGDLSVALLDSVSEGHEVGKVKIKESELLDVERSQDVHAVTEGHEVGVSGQFEGGLDQEKTTLKATVGAEYKYSKSTTDEQTSETTRAERELRRQEVHTIQTSGHEVQGGSIAVTVRMTNTGHVAFRVESAPVILRYRDDAGTLLAFGSLQPNFGFGQGPTLAAGQSKDVLYEIDGIGATDTLALLEDASDLELGLGDDLELAEIGVADIHVGAGNFAQYQDSVGQNTASFDLDSGRPGDGTERYLVSTSTFRDPDGRPLGLPMCDAVQVLLQRGLQVEDVTDDDGNAIEVFDDSDLGPEPAAIGFVSTALTGVETFGPQPVLVQNSGLQRYWILAVHNGAVGGTTVFEPNDVLLRARQAAQVVYFEDVDGDELEARDERIAETCEHTPHSDRDLECPGDPNDPIDPDDVGDGLTDREEVVDGWVVSFTDPTGSNVEYPVRSDPLSVDGDDDGQNDAQERALKTDPWRADTDGDGINDGEDATSSPSGITGSYYGSLDIHGDPVLVRTDGGVRFDWGVNSPSSALPVDHFAVRWTGSLVVPKSGDYLLRVPTDDSYELWVDGRPLLCSLGTPPGSCAPVLSLPLQASEAVPLDLSYWHRTGSARVALEYNDGAGWHVVPRGWLVTDPSRPNMPATGLSAEHYYTPDGVGEFDQKQLALREHDPAGPNHDYGDESPKDGIVPFDHFLSRWRGTLVVPADAGEGQYQFGGAHDDGMRVWLGDVDDDDQPIYDRWDDAVTSPTFGEQPVTLAPGDQLPIRVEHFDSTGNSLVGLYMTTPTGDQVPVPVSWMRPLTAFSPFQRTLTPGQVLVSNKSAGAPYTARLEVRGKNMEPCIFPTIAWDTQALCPIPEEAFDITVTGYRRTSDEPGDFIATHSYPLPVTRCFTFHGSAAAEKFSQDQSCPAGVP